MGKMEMAKLDDITWAQAHHYVIFQHEEVKPFTK